MKLLDEIKTVEERNLILNEIDLLKRRDTTNIRVNILETLRSVDLNDLKTKLSNLETVKITIAIEPTVAIVELIESFFQKNLKEKVLFDFEVDKNILGGLQIVYKGKYFDVSV